MIRVQVRPNETLEAALRRFKRQCNYAGIFRLAKKYTYHEKRSDRRRREELERIRNIHRAQKKLTRKTKTRTMKRSKVRSKPAGEGAESGSEISATDAKTTSETPSAVTAATAAPATPPPSQSSLVAEAGKTSGTAEA